MDFHPQSSLSLWHKLPEDLSQPESDFLQQLYLIGTTASLALRKQFPVLEISFLTKKIFSFKFSINLYLKEKKIASTKLEQEDTSCYFASQTSNSCLNNPKRT